MIKTLLGTENNYVALALRVALAVVIFPHGAQKLLGWWGGFGFEGTIGYFSSLGIPAIFGLLAILAEFFGAIGLLLGLLGRVAAVGAGAVMLTAAVMVHLPNGFFMNWFGNQQGEGMEYSVLGVAIAAAVAVKGSGALSLDRVLAGGRSSRTDGREPRGEGKKKPQGAHA